ncbi:MAG: hypothetical protein WBE22_01750 [Halobacteriota archaeon]
MIDNEIRVFFYGEVERRCQEGKGYGSSSFWKVKGHQGFPFGLNKRRIVDTKTQVVK